MTISILDPGQLPRGLSNLEKAEIAPPVFTQETKAAQRKYVKNKEVVFSAHRHVCLWLLALFAMYLQFEF